MKRIKNYFHPYPHLKEKFPELNRKLYEEHKIEFENWSDEEKKARGFGNHCHPRRFFIFLDKYYVLIKYFMTEEEKTNHVFPWVCATRSERLAALKKTNCYFKIKKTNLKLANLRKKNYELNKELLRNGENIKNIIDLIDFRFPIIN